MSALYVWIPSVQNSSTFSPATTPSTSTVSPNSKDSFAHFADTRSDLKNDVDIMKIGRRLNTIKNHLFIRR